MNINNKKPVGTALRESLTSRAAKMGGYSFLVSLVVLALLIAANVLVKSLPSRYTEFDISAVKLYSVSSSTKAVASGLKSDVTIYWVVQEGQEDSIISRLLSVYDGLSDYLTVVKKNPDIYPTFTAAYTDETVYNNSLIVESGSRYRYIPYSDLYEYDTSSYYYTQSISVTGFDGEGQITSAVSYVSQEKLPLIGLVTGHGETELPDTFAEALEKANFETEDFSFLTTDGATAAEKFDSVLIYAPTSDFSEEETEIIRDYLAAGGKLMVLSGTQQDGDLVTLKTLLNDYGLAAEDGVILESDTNYYYSSSYQRLPYILIPEIQDTDITSELKTNKSRILIAIAQPLVTSGSTPANVTTTALLKTSVSSYNKAEGYNLTTYTQEEDDEEGSFTIAWAIEDSSTDARLVWIGSDIVIEDSYISASSGANSDFAMNCLYFLQGKTESISIQSKSLEATTLTITTSEANWIKIVMMGIVPGCFLLYGLVELISRRKKR